MCFSLSRTCALFAKKWTLDSVLVTGIKADAPDFHPRPFYKWQLWCISFTVVWWWMCAGAAVYALVVSLEPPIALLTGCWHATDLFHHVASNPDLMGLSGSPISPLLNCVETFVKQQSLAQCESASVVVSLKNTFSSAWSPSSFVCLG